MAGVRPRDEAAQPDLLRFLTCGSVDDGKSTLIGRLLHDAGVVPRDQLERLEIHSGRFGTQGNAPDYALLLDGLAAEREQGITIDVAYRYFQTARRAFIVADTPGHEHYTRNMVTGASMADLAVILVDARKGVVTQTRRHAFLVHLLGVRSVVLAVNKLDLVGFDPAVHGKIADQFAAFAAEIGMGTFTAVPLCASDGDNVVHPSDRTPWYNGSTLLELLESAVGGSVRADRPFRMPVQWINRPDADFRGAAGLVADGSIAPGDPVRVMPSGTMSAVARIVSADGDLAEATDGQSITLTFTDPIDCARGDVVVAAEAPPEVADRFDATIVWLDEQPLIPGRSYLMKLATRTVGATMQPPKYEINVNTLDHLAAKTLGLNAIGVAEIATDQPIVFEPYTVSRSMGGFILIDRVTNATVAGGMINFALRRVHNLHWQNADVTREAHAALKGQRPLVLWLTGLSGAGKSTIANLVERKLHARGRHTFLLDGDNVRQGLNRDLGFTESDRIENIRRVGEVAKLMSDGGLIVLVAFISPFRAERALVRSMLPAGEFVEIFVDTPLAEAERRDPKGLYRKARSGELSNFTGIDSTYEPPEMPEITIDTTALSAEAAAERIVALVEERQQ